MDADGAECPYTLKAQRLAFIVIKISLAVHHMTDNLSIFFHYKIQFLDEIWILAISVKYKMLSTSRTIYVPKGLASKILHLTIVFRLFQTYFYSSLYFVICED